MNSTIIGALAALGGSSVGAIAPVLTSYILQRNITKRELTNREINLRESLYVEFIKEASRIYLVSVTHVLENLDDLVLLYSLVSRIRLFASAPVVAAAEDLVKRVVALYGGPNLTLEQVRTAALSATVDPLDVFSFACRAELKLLLRKGAGPDTIRS